MLMTILSNLLQLSFCIAVVAYVYCCILPAPNMILYRWFVFLHNKAAASVRYNRHKAAHDVWWFKILIGCEKCFAGQVAFWLYAYMCWQAGGYSIGLAAYHVFFICMSILLTVAIRKLVER